MEISCPVSTPAGQRKAIEELRRGIELAKQLQILISKSSSGDNETSVSASSGDLLERISNSFSCAISVLNNVDFGEVNQSGRKSEDSEGSSKTTAAVKDRRGCYKRRKTEEDTWSTETVNWEDGLAWRKYGQKVILNHKYPRNYYRCTHKSDGCQATKQVQQIGDDPPIHRTTYYGNHTCQDFVKQSQTSLFEDHDHSSAAVESSVLVLSFDGGSNLTNEQPDYDNKLKVNPFFSSSTSSLSIKQEQNADNYHHDVVQCDLTHNQSSACDYLFSPDEFTAFGSSLSSDRADVISWTASNHHNFNDMGSIDHFEDDVLKHYGFESL